MREWRNYNKVEVVEMRDEVLCNTDRWRGRGERAIQEGGSYVACMFVCRLIWKESSHQKNIR
jgi:hypothetical protein